MSIAEIDHAIATAEREFERISAGRYRRTRYLRFSATREARIGAVADRIAMLLRFRGMLWAKSRLTANE